MSAAPKRFYGISANTLVIEFCGFANVSHLITKRDFLEVSIHIYFTYPLLKRAFSWLFHLIKNEERIWIFFNLRLDLNL